MTDCWLSFQEPLEKTSTMNLSLKESKPESIVKYTLNSVRVSLIWGNITNIQTPTYHDQQSTYPHPETVSSNSFSSCLGYLHGISSYKIDFTLYRWANNEVDKPVFKPRTYQDQQETYPHPKNKESLVNSSHLGY